MSLEKYTFDLLETYFETNNENIDYLFENPSPLQFMRYLVKNRPFIVKGGCLTWPAVEKWNFGYLAQMMGDAEVDVAETPHG